MSETDDAPAVEPPGRAQAIDCGGSLYGFPYGWARAVVDAFERIDVPNGPPWLAGAVNLEGHVVPVLDLAAWLRPGEFTDTGPGARLLQGGDGEDRVAFVFRGAPVLVRWAPGDAALPPPARRLAGFVLGAGAGGHGDAARPCVVVDAPRLVDAFIAELVVA